jgi:hypothetical protein
MDMIAAIEQYKNAHKQYRDGLESPLVVYRYLMRLKPYQDMGLCESSGCDSSSTYLGHADKGYSVQCNKCNNQTYWFKTEYE